MSDEAYEAYLAKCAHFKMKPSSKEELERHEEVCEMVDEEFAKGSISVQRAKEFAVRAYELGYREAMREIAS